MQEDVGKCTQFIISQLSPATMSASANEKGSQKVRFFAWLVDQIDSGAYEGLRWLDKNRTIFRIPWKHSSRKSLELRDYRIFQAWAAVGGKYEEGSSNPSRLKTNFRNALKSTNRFQLLSSVPDPDPHRVYRIIPPNMAPEAIPPINSNNGSDPNDDLLHVGPHGEGAPALPHPAPLPQQEIEVTFGTLSLGNPGPAQNENAAENCYPCSADTLKWIIQQANLKQREVQQVSWGPAQAGDTNNLFDAGCEQDHCLPVPHVDQNSCLPLATGVLNQPVECSYYEAMSIPNVNSQSSATLLLQYMPQNAIPGPDQFNNVGATPYNDNYFIQHVFVNEEPQGNGVMNNAARSGYQMPANQQAVIEQNLLVPPAVPCPAERPPPNVPPLQNNEGGVVSHLGVSIYYRGRLLHETEVTGSSCMFTYNKHHPCGPAFGNPQVVPFPNPAELPDQKQVKHTLILLQKAGLLLYEQNHKIFAKRLDGCKVYWAFSKQLDNITQHSQFKCLIRDTETEIFDYVQFCQELKDFHENRRVTSPDYTIYLCFGQRFSAAKPKESKLILVKLVPKLCKEWHESVLREGSSSLSSDLSLQISNSLMDMIDQYLLDI